MYLEIDWKTFFQIVFVKVRIDNWMMTSCWLEYLEIFYSGRKADEMMLEFAKS